MANGNVLGVGLVFLLVITRICLDGHVTDDPTTLAMKRAGIYGPVMAGVCFFFGFILVWLVREGRHMDRQRAELQRLKETLARMDAEDRDRRRRSTVRRGMPR